MPVSQTRRSRAARRRSRRVAAADNDLTPAQWETLVDTWAACAYCGDTAGPFQKDCVLPISRGGRYTVENVVPASDFRASGFDGAYGVLMADGPLAGLLARAVVVIDKAGRVVYTELVPEITEEPDYDKAVEAVKAN